MRRYALEKPKILTRWREEMRKHGEYAHLCTCSKGPGVMRKRRPYDSCSPNQYCTCCDYVRMEKKQAKRRMRRAGRKVEIE